MASPTDPARLARGALDALPGRVAVVDGDGTIALANRSWATRDLPEEAYSGIHFPVGSDFLEALDAAGAPAARRLAEAVRGVLGGGAEAEEVVLDHTVRTPDASVQLRTHVAPLPDAGDEPRAVITQYDFTDRRSFEERLAESEGRARMLTEALDEVFSLSDPVRGRVVYLSPSFERVWGRPPGDLAEHPRRFLDWVHPGDRPAVRRHLAQRSVDEGWEEEYRIIRPDGSVRWIHSRVQPLAGPEGMGHVAGIHADVTARRVAEDQLTRSREEIHEILERLPVGVVIHQDGDVLYANRTAARYAGFSSPREMAELQLMDLIHRDDRAEVLKRIRRMAETGRAEPPCETRLLHRSGEWKSVNVVPVRVIQFEGRAANLLVVWDVTAQRRVEEALRRSQDRYMGIFEASAIGMALLDPDGWAVEVNDAFKALLGMESFEEGRVRLKSLMHPADRQKGWESFQQLLDGTLERYDREGRLQRSDGSYVWVHEHYSPVRDGEGRTQHALVLVEDVSEQKHLEEQLRLAQRIESIGRLAGGIAHDFNNLITVISGHTDILLGTLPPGDPAVPEIEDIQEAAKRAASLTRQLLAFSRRQVLQPRVVSLNDIVTSMRGMLTRIIGEDVELGFDLADDLGLVRADPGQIEQVILNLVVNARDAMPAGGRLRVTTCNAEFDDDFVRSHLGSRPGPHVGLEVRDTGHGMDDDTLSLVFEPFFTTKEPGKGTGLGLAMAYGIVKQSEGYIGVESEAGEGSAFTIYLPEVRGRPADVRQEESAGETPAGSETILLVEDEDMVRELARRILAGLGYTVIPAEDAAAAEEASAAHEGDIDLLLTDVIMPHVGGRELAERLVPTRPGMRVLYISGYADDTVVRHGVLDEKMPFLQKPFTPDLLARKVRSVLDE